MELKKYQKRVIADLSRYLELLRTTGNFVTAYRTFWREKGVPLGPDILPDYQNLLPGVPNLCFKVPTGGGKTFLACNAVRPVFHRSRQRSWSGWCHPTPSLNRPCKH